MIRIHINEGNIDAFRVPGPDQGWQTGVENSSGIGWESGRTSRCC